MAKDKIVLTIDLNKIRENELLVIKNGELVGVSIKELVDKETALIKKELEEYKNSFIVSKSRYDALCERLEIIVQTLQEGI